MINRDKFYFTIQGPFGTLSPEQKEGLEFLLDSFEADKRMVDPRWIAYCLATTKHETADTYQPIEEYGHGKGKGYGVPAENGKVYYGRGYVQLTFEDNYQDMGLRLNIDLHNKPELALVPELAYQIMVFGMIHGSFTGVGLPRYFNDLITDPFNARKIINSLDQAARIAEYYETFMVGLT